MRLTSTLLELALLSHANPPVKSRLKFVAKNWAAAMGFFNAVSEVAEAEGHHPDLHLTEWRNVRVDLSTHAIGGLSMPDLVLAAKIDAIEVEMSPKWLRQRQEAAISASSATEEIDESKRARR